jgi:hypothetical protein
MTLSDPITIPELEQRSRIGNDAAHNVEQFLEKFKNPFSLRDPRISERYLEGKLQVVVHIRCVSTAEQFLACFQGAVVSDRLEGRGCLSRDEAARKYGMGLWWNCLTAGKGGTCGQQEAVLVDAVKIVENPELVVPSHVWSGRVDEVDRVLTHSAYFSVRTRALIPLERFVDGIRRVPVGSLSVCNDELPREVVKRGPQVVEGVPSDQRNFCWNIVNTGDEVIYRSRIRIVLGLNSIWVGLDESTDRIAQVVDVLFGPFYFVLNETRSDSA